MRRDRFIGVASRAVAPIWLGGLILFGGSSQPDQLSHLGLQFAASLVVLCCIFPARNTQWSRAMTAFVALGCALITWAIFQTIPLSPGIWTELPDRTLVSESWVLLGLESNRAYPISFIPSETRTAIMGFLPALATLLLILAVGRKVAGPYLYWAIPIFGAASALLGIAQVTTSADQFLRWHSITNPTFATGVFANANHQSTLCLMCIPFAAALGSRLRRDWSGGDDDVGKAAFVGGLFLLNTVGVLTAGSFAGYSLLVPALIFSFFLFARTERSSEKRNHAPLIISAAIVLGSIALVASSPVLDGLGVTSFEDGDLSRLGVWRTSTSMAETHLITGTGLGTFTETYRLYESDANLTSRYINNAHNDYLQIVIELGVPGILVPGAMLVLFFICFARTWMGREDEEFRFRRASAVAVLIPILHSVVDYPLRTPAIACLATVCLVLMIAPLRRSKKPSKKESSEPSPGHAVI